MSRRAVAGVLAILALAAGCASEPVPAPAAPGAMIEIRLIAQGIAFTPADVGALPGVPLRLAMDNRDPGVPHNIALVAGGVTVTETEIVTGPAEAAIDVPGLPPGRYQLTCAVHPNMVATLHVD